MQATRGNRGFTLVSHTKYPPDKGAGRLLQESSAIGAYDDGMDNPGSSFLWIGEDFHLNREEVAEMIRLMQGWLDTKRLPFSDEGGS